MAFEFGGLCVASGYTHSMQLSVVNLMSTSKTTPSLLDTLAVWLTTPVQAYEHWIRRQGFRATSQRVYLAMFGRFCQWLNEQSIPLDRCSSAHIAAFLAAENPNLPEPRRNPQTGRQRQQYVRLLERVFAHLGTLGWTGPNPGSQAGVERVGAGSDQPTRFLSAEDREAVIELVLSRLAALGSAPVDLENWVVYRDLALIGATLGAGLKPGQVSSLSLNCIDLEQGVIDCSVTAHSHRAVLRPFAREALGAWVTVLKQLSEESVSMVGRAGGTPEQWRRSQLVFIADRSGRGFGRFSLTQRMHVSSIFRRIQSFLEDAGVTGSRASPQTLRNTYAALLIEGGASTMELVTCLGLATDMTAQRIRASWAAAYSSPEGNS